MVGFIRIADKLSLWVGHCFSWCIMILILAVSYEFVRYALHAPTAWAFDISYIMYGTRSWRLHPLRGRSCPRRHVVPQAFAATAGSARAGALHCSSSWHIALIYFGTIYAAQA